MKDWKQPLMDAMKATGDDEANVESIETLKNDYVTVTTTTHVYTSQGDKFIAIKR